MRPVWLVVVLLAVATPLVAALFAFAAYIYAYAIIGDSVLIGAVGGIFAALLTDRLKVSSGFLVMLAGVLFGLAIYGLYWFFFYLFMVPGSVISFVDFVLAVAQNSTLRRLGGSSLDIGPLTFAAIKLLEIGLVILLSTIMARAMHKLFRKF